MVEAIVESAKSFTIKAIEFLQKGKVVMVKKEELIPNPLNPRIDIDTTDIDSSVKDNGIMTPILCNLHKEIYRGHRRLISVMKTSHEMVPCVMFDDSKLSETDKYEILLDHSMEKPLSKAEAFIAIRHLFHLGYGEMAVIRRCASILNLAFGSPSPEAIADARKTAISLHEDADRAEMVIIEKKHRGTVQNMKRLALLPDAVADEYIKAWKGRNSELTQKDVKVLSDLWDDLVKVDPATNRSNPPLEFNAKVEELRAINAKADSTPAGEKKQKRNSSDIVNMAKACEDPKVRKTLSWVLGDITDQELIQYVKELNSNGK